MVANARVADLIREARADEIHDAIADGAFHEMQTFLQALIALVLDERVDEEVAANAATNRHDFQVALDAAKKHRAADAAEAAAQAAAASAGENGGTAEDGVAVAVQPLGASLR